MRKNLLENKGFPMSVDYIADLRAMDNGLSDSWYFKTEFTSDGKNLGFTWHPMVQYVDGIPFMSIESNLMNASDNIWLNNSAMFPMDGEKNCADTTHMDVRCEWGVMAGDEKHMTLDAAFNGNEIHMSFESNGEVLFNAATGLLRLGNSGSMQYSFPNMKMSGTFCMQGHTYTVKDASAWFDRQYSMLFDPSKGASAAPGQNNWLWIGQPRLKNGKGAVSLWDIYFGDIRFAFATFSREDGSQINANCEITYEKIWKSTESGHSYPDVIHVKCPQEDYEMTFTCLDTTHSAEFVHEKVKAMSGIQCLYRAQGNYQGTEIDSINDVEVIGDLCGEI